MSVDRLRGSVNKLLELCSPQGLSVDQMIHAFGIRSHSFLIVMFSLPFVQPFPLFGLSTPLGLCIAVLGVLMAFDKPPWLPKKMTQKMIPLQLIENCTRVLNKILTKTEFFIKPRWNWWFEIKASKYIDGFLIALYGILLALPLPIPFTNSIPANFLIFNAIGRLERDGVVIMLSHIFAVGGIIFFIAIGGGIVELVQYARLKFGI